MQLNKNNEIIDSLLQKESDIHFKALKCWSNAQENYNIYIFSIQLKDEAELKNVKDDLRDYLAIYFQSQTLEKDVERWNIYQVFLVEESVNKDIKLQIEQDKFATRKLVVDKIGKEPSDEEVRGILNSLIFQFEISSNNMTSKKLDDVLNEDEISLFSSIEEAEGNIDELLKQMENEQD